MTSVSAWQDVERLAKKVCGQCLARARAAGLRLDMDDFMSVAHETWVRAAQGFDASNGAKFTTYFCSALKKNLNREINMALRNVDAVAISIDDEKSGWSETIGESDDATLDFERAQHAEKMLSRASFELRFVVLQLMKPDDWVMHEFKAINARQLRAREMGIHAPEQLFNIAFLGKVLGLPWPRRKMLKAEVANILEKAA